MITEPASEFVAERTAQIIEHNLFSSRSKLDRLFAVLMVLQWLAAIVGSLLLSPYTWDGAQSRIHVHVWFALGIGTVLSSLPIFLAFRHPGTGTTRHVISVSQVLFSSLFMHLSGGRIESHFHVFVSLAFLSLYRDWRVLVTATLITSADHLARGYFLPQSIYGVLTASPWRTVEHACWVVLEDVFLIIAGNENLYSVCRAARREAELESMSGEFESQVFQRTREAVLARQSAEDALKERNTLREILDEHTLVSVKDRFGNITYANKEFCRLSGYEFEELVGKNEQMLDSETHPALLWDRMENSLLSGKPWRGEICCRAKDGSQYWLDTKTLPQSDAKGEVDNFVSLGFDITDKKKAEVSLVLANERFRALAAAVERSPNATIITDINGVVRFANPAAQKLDEVFDHQLSIDSRALVFDSGRLDAGIQKSIISTVLSGQVYCGEVACRLVKSFQQTDLPELIRHLSLTASPLICENGQIDGILLAQRDITDEFQRNRSLEEITTAMDAATDCVFIIDAETMQFVYANKAANKHIGYDLPDLRGIAPSEVSPYFDGNTLANLIELPPEKSAALKVRTEHRHRDGHRIPVDVALQFLPNIGEKGRFFAVVRDVTEQVASEKALEAARVQAEQSSRSKSEFLANMSHEIRTPMTAIIGFADLLDIDGDFSRDPANAANAVQTIRTNANHLLAIINDILDMSKIEAGKMTVEKLIFPPESIVEEVASLMRPRAIGKGIRLDLCYEGKIPAKLISDPTRLRQILLNLVGNAIKFTEVGGVTILTRYLSHTNQIQFSVKDTGIGMCHAQRDRIAKFEAFAQADGSTSRQFGGTGLGLRISNSLAGMLGGCIEVESQIGVGSTVSVSVDAGSLGSVDFAAREAPSTHEVRPGEKPVAPRSDTKGNTDLSGLRILLAEDGPDNQRLISFHLRKAGAEVTIAENGRIAAELIEQTGAEYDLVLMDMQMPELDGYDATKRLRAGGHRIPIVALTAHAMESDRQKCLNAGCDGFTTKPINRQVLLETAKEFATRSKPLLVDSLQTPLQVQRTH